MRPTGKREQISAPSDVRSYQGDRGAVMTSVMPIASNAMAECRTIRFVSVPQQIARCIVPRKGLGHLAGKPDTCVGFGVISK